MPDTFTEVTNESWFGRLGNAFKGVLIGLLLFLLAFPLLFWNEGHAVKRYKTLKEGGGAVASIDCSAVDPDNDGQLVHITGLADTEETLADLEFGISRTALQLHRSVKMFQWVEHADKKTRKKAGGGTKTTTNYTYKKAWAARAVDSSAFHEPNGHRNPEQMRFLSEQWIANRVTLGAFTLPPSLVSKVNLTAPVEAPPVESVPETIQEALRETLQPYAGGFFLGRDPASPEVGDLRIAFHAVSPTDVSIIARQAGTTFEPFEASTGGEIELLQLGTHSSEAMIEQAQAGNRNMTWLLRAVGFVLMLIGLGMILNPLSVLADVVPFIGSIVGAGTGLIAFLGALALSAVTIAVAWLTYRPLLGVGLLVVAGIVGFLITRALRKASPAVAPPPGDG